MRILLTLLLITVLTLFHESSFGCSHKVPSKYYEKYDGNSLSYPSAGMVGLFTVLASSIATGFEGDDTSKAVPGIAAFGLYAVACLGMGTDDVMTKEEYESRLLTKEFIEIPKNPQERITEKQKFLSRQREFDKWSTLVSVVVNLGNGISARYDSNKTIGFGGALINILYAALDPNGTRVNLIPLQPEDKSSDQASNGVLLQFAWDIE